MRFGWNVAKNNILFFFVLLIITSVLFMAPDTITTMAMEVNVFLGFIFHIADMVLTLIISIGLIKIALKFHDNEKSRYSDLFSQYHLLFKYFFAIILFYLILLGGFLLLIIPGIILMIRLWFFDYLIVDKGLGPIKALKKSFAITKGHTWNLFVFTMLILGINILGALALLVGLFITIPTSMIALAFVYRKLLAQEEIIQTPGISPTVENIAHKPY